MRSINYNEQCSRCNCGITFNESDYSTTHFQIPLCFTCQQWYKDLKTKPTAYAKKLFLSLRNKGFRLKLEDNEQMQTIDISSDDSMIHIEVDGSQHTNNADQAVRDLWRTYFSIKKGYYTLHVPNLAIKEDFEQTVRALSHILIERKNQKQAKNELPNYSFQQRLINAFVRNMKE